MLRSSLIIIIFIIVICYFCTLEGSGYSSTQRSIDNCNIEETNGDVSNRDNIQEKPYMWVYWELINNVKTVPPYITMCMDIMKKNTSGTFKMVLLNEKTVFDYLPDLRQDINDLPIALKTDYVRVRLLARYGGLWVDADTIVMTDLREIAQKINQGVDYIGIGCTGAICLDQEGLGKPSNSVMGSVKNGRLISRCLKELDIKLNSYYQTPVKDRKEFDYFDLGKIIIWNEYQKLKTEDPEYTLYHVPSYADGSRDSDGRWVAMNLIFPQPIKYAKKDKLMVVLMVNSAYCGKDPHYNWFCKLEIPDILSGNYFVTQLFKTALSYDPMKHTC